MQATSSILVKLNNRSDTFLAWQMTIIASLFFMYVFIQLNLFNSIDVALMRAFNLNAKDLGELSSLYFYANVLFLFPAGILLDRTSTKKILLMAVAISTLGTFLFALSSTYWMAGFGRFLVGTGGAFSFLSCMRLATRWFPPQKMALATGMVVTMAMLGGLIAQTPMALLSEWLGWRQAVLLDASLGILIGFLILFFLQDRPANQQGLENAEKTQLANLGLFQSIKLVFKNKYNWLGGLYTSLLNLPVFLLGALWGIHYLHRVHHFTTVQASYATTFFFLGVILGSPFYGWLSDTMGRRVLPMLLGAVLSLLCLFLLLWVPAISLISAILLFFAIGFFTSSQVLTYPTIAELNPAILSSTAISIISITVMLSGALVQPLFGWLMESHWNHTVINGVHFYSAGDFFNAMLIMPIACVIGFFLGFLIKETYCKSEL